MRKRITGILLAVLILSIAATTVYAATMSPRWINTQSMTLSLSFSGGQANAASIINGNRNTASIVATYSLQERVGNTWVTVHTWPTVTSDSMRLGFTGTASATSGRTYRLFVTATVTNTSGVSETITNYHVRVFN